MDTSYKTNEGEDTPKWRQMIFGDSFFTDYAGMLVANPNIALVELVANSFDAGADRINITWPENFTQNFTIEDNGVGMTADEFQYRWYHLNYNRTREQGFEIQFPTGNRISQRKAFGKNGKGRFSVFCFCDEYHVETWKDGISSVFQVIRTTTDRSKPYDIFLERKYPKLKHGTILTGKIERHYLGIETVKTLLWSKFVADPAVEIFVNNQKVDLIHFGNQLVTRSVNTKWGSVPIHFISGEITGKTSLQHGIAWWVNGKSVGEISWERMSERGLFIDRRTIEGKRFTFIVQADILENFVKFDWSEFQRNDIISREVLSEVESFIEAWLRELTYGSRHEDKKLIIQENREKISTLPKFSQEIVGNFITSVQDKIPTIGHDVLSNAVSVLCTIESARSGRELLAQLAKIKPEDVDLLNDLLKKWSIRDAKIVLDELYWRLDIIKQLQELVEDKHTLELKQLQPLFAQGLWIFGPEYDGGLFSSNRNLNTVIQKLLLPGIEGNVSEEMAKKRPDFVILPDATIGSYARVGFDPDTSEINGIEKAIIVELKRGGFVITNEEIRQAENYAISILKSGKVIRSRSCIACYVLGAEIDPMAEPSKKGNNDEIIVTPLPYSTVLLKAHSRTFNLLRHIRDNKPDIFYDEDMETVLGDPYQHPLDLDSSGLENVLIRHPSPDTDQISEAIKD
ncbi:MAG TPA: ATP-binding protein [Bellilinea sp.]|nr:ATP-binding protein [Bellilinea sp.]